MRVICRDVSWACAIKTFSLLSFYFLALTLSVCSVPLRLLSIRHPLRFDFMMSFCKMNRLQTAKLRKMTIETAQEREKEILKKQRTRDYKVGYRQNSNGNKWFLYEIMPPTKKNRLHKQPNQIDRTNMLGIALCIVFYHLNFKLASFLFVVIEETIQSIGAISLLPFWFVAYLYYFHIESVRFVFEQQQKSGESCRQNTYDDKYRSIRSIFAFFALYCLLYKIHNFSTLHK